MKKRYTLHGTNDVNAHVPGPGTFLLVDVEVEMNREVHAWQASSGHEVVYVGKPDETAVRVALVGLSKVLAVKGEM